MQARWIRLLFLCVFFCEKAEANSHADSILFKPYADQYNYRSYLMDEWSLSSKSASDMLASIDDLLQLANDKGDVRLSYGSIISKNNFILRKKMPDTLLAESVLLKLVPELENDRMYDLKAEALQDLAGFYWDRKKYPEAFENFISAYSLYSKFSRSAFPGKPGYLSEFGGKYYVFGDYENAVNYTLEAYRAIPDKDIDQNLTILNTVGLCYMNLGKLDSAEYYYLRGYNRALKIGSEQWQGIISGNLGYLYIKLGKYNEALPWFEKEIGILGNKQSMNVANTYAVLSGVYIPRGEKERAKELAIRAYNILRTKDGYTKRYEASRVIYMALAKAYAAYGEMDKAYKFLDSGMVAKDSVERKVNANILAGIQHKIRANDMLLEHDRFEKDKQNNRILRYILVATILLLIIVAILLINRQRLKYSFSRKRLEAEKQHVEAELGIATQQLNTLVGSISDKNELIEKFSEELNLLRGHLSDDKLTKADEALTHLQKATIITDEEWDQFSLTFERVHKGFLKRLHGKVKGLSPIETKFIMLSKMKLSTNQVAAALGISPDSVRLNRKRLYSKLGLTEGEHSLHVLIDSI